MTQTSHQSAPGKGVEPNWQQSICQPQTGTVKWYHPLKGIGYIRPDDGGKDVYLYQSILLPARMLKLQAGSRVAFLRVTIRGFTHAKDISFI